MNGLKHKLIALFLYSAGILIFSGGCFSSPGNFKTLADYRRTFAPSPRVFLSENTSLTLQKAQQISLANNPTIRASIGAVSAAKYNYERSLSAYLPRLDLSGSAGHFIDDGYNLHDPPPGIMKRNAHFVSTGSLQATLLLFDGLARELNVRLAKLEYDDRTSADMNVKRLLKRAVAYAYWDILLASEEIRIARADEKFQTAALRQAKIQFKSGHVSKASVLNFEILAAQARSNAQNARYRQQIARHALTALLGFARQDFPENIRFPDIRLSRFAPPPDEESCLEQAILNRPDLQQEKIQLETALRQKQLVYAQFLPQLHLFSEYTLGSFAARYSGSSAPGAYYNQADFSYGITGTWNIFNGWNSLNQLRRKKVLEKIAFWGLNSKYLEIAAEIKDALAHYRNTGIQIQIYTKISQWVTLQRDLVYNEYQNGRETITRVNQAQSLCVEAQNRLVLWLVQSHKAAAQLNAAAGKSLLKE